MVNLPCTMNMFIIKTKKGCFMQNELICYASKAVWVIAIVALLNMGLMPFGYNIFQTELFETTLNWAVNPIHYLAGLAGLLGLCRLIKACMHGGSWCGCSSGATSSMYKGGCPCGRPNCNCH
jgi:uncharacterized membrane protein YuzA (DUF378 family)